MSEGQPCPSSFRRWSLASTRKERGSRAASLLCTAQCQLLLRRKLKPREEPRCTQGRPSSKRLGSNPTTEQDTRCPYGITRNPTQTHQEASELRSSLVPSSSQIEGILKHKLVNSSINLHWPILNKRTSEHLPCLLSRAWLSVLRTCGVLAHPTCKTILLQAGITSPILGAETKGSERLSRSG